MATIYFTFDEGGPVYCHHGIHSVIFPDGLRWDEVNGVNKDKVPSEKMKDYSRMFPKLGEI